MNDHQSKANASADARAVAALAPWSHGCQVGSPSGCRGVPALRTTRKPRPGRHLVDVLFNGAPLPAGWFDVPEARRPSK